MATSTLNPAAALSSAQRLALERGTVLVTSPELVQNGRVRLALAAYGADPGAAGVLRRTIDIPVDQSSSPG